MRFKITSRFTGLPIYTCELPPEMADKPYSMQLGYAFQSAVFDGISLRAADLRGADMCDTDLSDTDLSDTDLREANLRFANLRGADLRGADLRGADMCEADLRGADLSGADLGEANLRGADFCESPIKVDNIHQAIYRSASQPGALNMSTWHTRYGTTHCRAGWVIALAGDAGKELESRIGTSAAAALIYMSNDPELERIPDFYCDAETALQDMQRLSELEAARPGAQEWTAGDVVEEIPNPTLSALADD